jgi:hypothetical protein
MEDVLQLSSTPHEVGEDVRILSKFYKIGSLTQKLSS